MANRDKRWAEFAADMVRQAGEVDNRLTPGQMHMAVVCALHGREPLVIAAELVGLSLEPNSKVAMSEPETAKIAMAIHDRLYEAEERQKRRAGADADQFSLEFSWAAKETA
jgi:uncharacterized membrane protein